MNGVIATSQVRSIWQANRALGLLGAKTFSSSCSSSFGGGMSPSASTKHVPQIPVRQPNKTGAFWTVSVSAKGWWIATESALNFEFGKETVHLSISQFLSSSRILGTVISLWLRLFQCLKQTLGQFSSLHGNRESPLIRRLIFLYAEILMDAWSWGRSPPPTSNINFTNYNGITRGISTSLKSRPLRIVCLTPCSLNSKMRYPKYNE